MTEAEWLTCADPQPMFEFARDQASARKLRLFAVACWRRNPYLVTGARAAQTVDQAERSADWPAGPGAGAAAVGLDLDALWGAAMAALFAANTDATFRGDSAARDDLCCYLRCIFGHLFPRPAPPSKPPSGLTAFVAGVVKVIAGSPLRQGHDSGDDKPVLPVPKFDQAWRTSTVVALARTVYEDRAFDRLPILADALEDAGCDHPNILTHCRDEGPHVRGCWVVDLLLGTS
jgi:hypothetical protein